MNTSHGMSKTRLYTIWKKMKARCENSNQDRFLDYGGRGIQVCLAWRDFVVFRDWALANGYDDNLTLDRKDNNGNYEPDNCRWITSVEQQQNKRNSSKIEINGIVDSFVGWSKRTGISVNTLYTRYYRDSKRGIKLLGGDT